MNTCSKCGTRFDSPCCPNCGTMAQTQVNPNATQQLPPPIPPQQQYQPNQFGQPVQPKKKKHGCLVAILFAIGIFVFLGVIGSLLNNEDPKVVDTTSGDQSSDDAASVDNASDTAEKVTPVPEKTTFTIGETVELNDILVTLVGVTESTGSDYNKPTEENVFVLCEFEIANNSDNDIAVSSIISFEAYCDDYSINQSFSAIMEKGDKNQLDGSVASGKRMNGVIGYEIPSDWKELEINYAPSFWSSKDITFIATK